MLALISSIPTTVRDGFDVQDLPLRATSVSVEQMSEVFGGDCFSGSMFTSCTSGPTLSDRARSRCRNTNKGVLSGYSLSRSCGSNTYQAIRYTCCR